MEAVDHHLSDSPIRHRPRVHLLCDLQLLRLDSRAVVTAHWNLPGRDLCRGHWLHHPQLLPSAVLVVLRVDVSQEAAEACKGSGEECHLQSRANRGQRCEGY